MEDDLSSVASADQQAKIRNAVKAFKNDLTKKKNELKRLRENSVSERESLLGSKDNNTIGSSNYYQNNNNNGNGYQNNNNNNDDYDENEFDYRKRLLKSQSRAERSNQQLEHSIRMLEESNEIGQASAAKLSEQGDQIRRTQARVDEMNGDLASGSSTITHMQRRQITNKIILVLVILGLLLVILIICGFIFGPIIYTLIKKSQQT